MGYVIAKNGERFKANEESGIIALTSVRDLDRISAIIGSGGSLATAAANGVIKIFTFVTEEFEKEAKQKAEQAAQEDAFVFAGESDNWDKVSFFTGNIEDLKSLVSKFSEEKFEDAAADFLVPYPPKENFLAFRTNYADVRKYFLAPREKTE